MIIASFLLAAGAFFVAAYSLGWSMGYAAGESNKDIVSVTPEIIDSASLDRYDNYNKDGKIVPYK